MTIGPMQLAVVGFDGDVMESNVIDELFTASQSGDIRLIDMLVVEKDDEGNTWSAEISDLTLEEEISFGALLGGLIGLGADGAEGVEAGAEAGAEVVATTGSVLGLTPFDVNDLVHDIPIGHSGIVVLFEHRWASRLHDATLAAGGLMLGQAMIQPEGLVLLGKELEAAMEAAAVVEAAQLIELEAAEEAAEAVTLSEAIQEEAARRAIAALITAEMIEEAAIEEATVIVQAALAAEEAAGKE